MSADVETIVVGAGVVGLAIARALAVRGHQVIVLEKNSRAGAETSSRSSEVIHAGLYYPPGSLKARLCVAGKAMLYRFCEENQIDTRRCGKLVVATSQTELPRLGALAATASANGVHDLVMLSAQDARKIEPEISCVGAVLSPSTGILDSHGLISALEGHLAGLGGEVVLNTQVTGIGRKGQDEDFEITAESSGESTRIIARHLVIAAGLAATTLGRMLRYDGGYSPPETAFAKGHYYALKGRAPFRHLVYPLPTAASLGIHLTLDVGGRARFGPDVAWRDSIDYSFEDADGSRLAHFEREVRRYWPELPEGALVPDTTGIRPKLSRRGEPPADFAVHGPREHGIPRLVALYGVESPGITASLALAEYVAGLLER